ncbi:MULTISPECIES: hypothetical protein [Corynebacterium]|uniref:Uncharacterized protein n=1 Tax=Corynebacterium lipophilum TaxID=2804918 RepID=A0AAW5HYW5_9CORY|nr:MULTISPECIES: hypothetical protein [Corynebacterium]MCO6395423.1 hypothetical protein [Corynebacterium lipophilum]MCZ2118154.1 hypothetical protein [Corynebacterium lipophilum]OIR41755.1 hypothetical protein BJP06_09585 [Corynebacterium sp. NML120713]
MKRIVASITAVAMLATTATPANAANAKYQNGTCAFTLFDDELPSLKASTIAPKKALSEAGLREAFALVTPQEASDKLTLLDQEVAALTKQRSELLDATTNGTADEQQLKQLNSQLKFLRAFEPALKACSQREDYKGRVVRSPRPKQTGPKQTGSIGNSEGSSIKDVSPAEMRDWLSVAGPLAGIFLAVALGAAALVTVVFPEMAPKLPF